MVCGEPGAAGWILQLGDRVVEHAITVHAERIVDGRPMWCDVGQHGIPAVGEALRHPVDELVEFV